MEPETKKKYTQLKGECNYTNCACRQCKLTICAQENKTNTTIKKGPLDVLGSIFSYIPYSGVWFELMLTCKKFFETALLHLDPLELDGVALRRTCRTKDMQAMKRLMIHPQIEIDTVEGLKNHMYFGLPHALIFGWLDYAKEILERAARQVKADIEAIDAAWCVVNTVPIFRQTMRGNLGFGEWMWRFLKQHPHFLDPNPGEKTTPTRIMITKAYEAFSYEMILAFLSRDVTTIKIMILEDFITVDDIRQWISRLSSSPTTEQEMYFNYVTLGAIMELSETFPVIDEHTSVEIFRMLRYRLYDLESFLVCMKHGTPNGEQINFYLDLAIQRGHVDALRAILQRKDLAYKNVTPDTIKSIVGLDATIFEMIARSTLDFKHNLNPSCYDSLIEIAQIINDHTSLAWLINKMKDYDQKQFTYSLARWIPNCQSRHTTNLLLVEAQKLSPKALYGLGWDLYLHDFQCDDDGHLTPWRFECFISNDIILKKVTDNYLYLSYKPYHRLIGSTSFQSLSSLSTENQNSTRLWTLYERATTYTRSYWEHTIQKTI